MSITWLFLDALRAAALFGVALIFYVMLRGQAARVRQLVLAAALVATVLAPMAARIFALSPTTLTVDLSRLSVVPVAEPEGAAIAPLDIATGAAPTATPLRHAALVEETAKRANLAMWAIVAWAVGAAIVLSRLGAGLLGARRLVRGADREVALPFAAVIATTLREADASAEVAISDDVRSPAVAGSWHPTILMPRAALEWTASRWRVVLLHELAHVRRRDCLMSALTQIVCALHWFDPLAWVTRMYWRKECELAADEAVLACGVRPSEYAEHLIGVAAGIGAKPIANGSLAMASQPSTLVNRVETIVREGALRRPSARVTRAIAVVSPLLTLAVACAGPRDPRAPSETAAATNAPGTDCAAYAFSGSCLPPEPPTVELGDLVARVTGSAKERNELTIDPRLQAIADEEITRVVATFHARMATAIILDPAKGEILALANPDAARQAYITGSTMKALTIAAALDAKLVRVDQKFDCRPRPNEFPGIVDMTPHESLDLAEILEVSSNVGALRVYQALGDDRFHRALKAFHLADEKLSVQVGFRQFSPLGKHDRAFAPSSEKAAVGEGFVSTPLQMIGVYGVFANGGEYVAPSVVRSMRDTNGGVAWRHTPKRDPVVRSESARSVMEMLELAVDGTQATGKAARIPGVRVAGKTGTSNMDDRGATQVYASFIGIVPADAPRYVILVGVIDPSDGAGGGTVAAPAFARIASRALALSEPGAR